MPEQSHLLRSLQDFGRPPQSGGKAEYTVEVADGYGTARSIGLVPDGVRLDAELTASFTLDGEPISAADLVGRSGVVTALYTVHNRTRHEVEVPITATGSGEEEVRKVQADVPMAVIAKTLLPQRYTGLSTGHGLYGADGRGNFQVQWIALPFAPLAEDGTSTFGWAANVTDAVVPSMIVQVAPIYLPAHDDEAEAEADEDSGGGGGGGVPGLDPVLADITAGLEQVVTGLEGFASDDSPDPLDALEGNLDAFFTEFGANLQAVADLADPDNPDSVTSTLRELQDAVEQARDALDAYDSSQVPEAIETIDGNFDEVFAAVEGVLGVLDKIVPGSGNPEAACTLLAQIEDATVSEQECRDAVALLERAAADKDVTEQAIDTLNNVLNEIDGAVEVLSPLLESVASLLSDVDARLLDLNDQLTTISTGLVESDVDLPTTDQAVSEVVESILSSPDGQLVVGGMDQVSSGVAQAKSLVSDYVADVVAQVRAAGADSAAVVDDLKAEVGGITVAAQRSPLPYGGDVSEAPEGTQLSGAYEFRLDAADSNGPNTLWRILWGLVLLLGAGALVTWLHRRDAGAGEATDVTEPPETSRDATVVVAPVTAEGTAVPPDADRTGPADSAEATPGIQGTTGRAGEDRPPA